MNISIKSNGCHLATYAFLLRTNIEGSFFIPTDKVLVVVHVKALPVLFEEFVALFLHESNCLVDAFIHKGILIKACFWISKKAEIDFEPIIKLSEGFNGADLRNVCTEAGMYAIRADRDYVVQEDFIKAVRKIAEAKKLESKIDYQKV